MCTIIHVYLVYSPLCVSLAGHSDVLMGVICVNDEELEKRLRFVQFGMLYYLLLRLSNMRGVPTA